MAYVAAEDIVKAKQIDLLSYLQACEPDQLVKVTRDIYCTKEHDSLKISNGKWMWWSRGIGGRNAIDYLTKVQGYDFSDAVKAVLINDDVVKSAMPSVQKQEERAAEVPLHLPEKSKNTDRVTQYLFGRGIDMEIIGYCLDNGLIYESLPYHNVVFVGYDEQRKAKYAAYRATNPSRIMGDCLGSKKRYSFRISDGKGRDMHLFESAIDLLSYATLLKLNGRNWQNRNLVSPSGVYLPKENLAESKIPPSLEVFLDKHPNISRIYLHLDNDEAGRKASAALKATLSDRYEVVDNPPPSGKDVNDFLCNELCISRNKQKRERSYER